MNRKMQIDEDPQMERSRGSSRSSKLDQPPIRGSGAIVLLRLIPSISMHLLLLLNLFHSLPAALCAIRISKDSGDQQPLAAYPLIYTRLRHDDNYLQIYRNLQLEHPYEEVELPSERWFNRRHTYYVNKHVESNLTQDDLILEALDRTYKTRLLPAYLYNYDNPKDRDRASDPSLISEGKCRLELEYLANKLHLVRSGAPLDPELAAFFDSFASEEPGLLFGNYHWVGNWRQCHKRLVFDMNSDVPNVTEFSGRYCIASLRSPRWEKKIGERAKELKENYFKYPEQQYDYARFFRVQVGICLPESCDSRTFDTQRELIRQLTVHKLQEPLRSYQLADLFCLPDETSELRRLPASAWLLILLALGWSSAILAATAHDWRSPPPVKGAPKTCIDKLVSAMSLLRNYERLTETRSLTPPAPATKPDEPPKLAPNDLLFLNAFKVISMPCILFGHTGMLYIMLNRYPLDYEALETRALTHFNISTIFFVDWYFVITGFLMGYLTFVTRKVERSSPFQWLYTVFHRYWRLAPIYILLFWFSRSLFKYTAHGPVWDYGTNNMTLRSVCQRESWLWPLLLAPNFHPIHEECIMPAWYLANDFQFYLITPLLLVALSRRPLLTWFATVGAIFGCMGARFQRYMTDARAQPLELMRPRYDAYMRNNWDMHPTYIQPQYRVSSYLVGLLAGHYTYMVLSGKWRSPIYAHPSLAATKTSSPFWSLFRSERVRWWLRCLLCLFGLYQLVAMKFASWIISDLFPRSLEPQVKYYTAAIYGISHTTTALSLSLICVTLMLGQFGPLRRFLSHRLFSLVSRVNFFVFIAQVEVIYWLAQSSERLIDLSPRDAFKGWILLSAICYPLAALATLWLELPLANLEREFIGSRVMASPHRATAAAAASRSAGQSADGERAKMIVDENGNVCPESKSNKSRANNDDDDGRENTTSFDCEQQQQQSASVGGGDGKSHDNVEVRIHH